MSKVPIDNLIQYHFSSHPINRTRVLLRSLGLFIRTYPSILVGLIVFFSISIGLEFFILVPAVKHSKSVSDFTMLRDTLNALLLFTGLIWLTWRIKWFADHSVKVSWGQTSFVLLKTLPLIIFYTILFSISISAVSFISLFALILLPAFLTLLPLYMIGNLSMIKAFARSFTIIWGNLYYSLSALFLFVFFMIAPSYLFSQKPIAMMNAHSLLWFYLTKESLRWFIMMPLFASFQINVLNNMYLRKYSTGLPRLLAPRSVQDFLKYFK